MIAERSRCERQAEGLKRLLWFVGRGDKQEVLDAAFLSVLLKGPEAKNATSFRRLATSHKPHLAANW